MYLLLSMNFRLQYRISLILIFLQWIIPLVSAASYGPNPYWDADNNVYDLGWIPLRVNSWAIIAWWNLWIGVINPGYRVDVSGYMNSSSGLCIGWDCKGSWSEVGWSLPIWANTGNSLRWTWTGWEHSDVGDLLINWITIGRGSGNLIWNTALGINVLRVNTTGDANVWIWQEALPANTTGYENTAVWLMSLGSNSTWYKNTALWSNALFYNSTGNRNTAIWVSALETNYGSQNSALWSSALYSLYSGMNNTAIWYRAGYNLWQWDNNIAIGANTDYFSSTNSNQLNIGNWIYGSGWDIGIGTNNPLALLDINGSSLLRGNVSMQNWYMWWLTQYSGSAGYKLLKLGASNWAWWRIQFANGQAWGDFDVGLFRESAGTLSIDNNTNWSGNLIVTGTGTFSGLRLTTGVMSGHLLISDGSGNATWQAPTDRGWGLSGNGGTNPLTQFIWTTDDTDLIFKRNNTIAWILNIWTVLWGDTAWWVGALGNFYSFSNWGNTAIWFASLGYNEIGVGNVWLWVGSLYSNINGSTNVAIGYNTLFNNTEGSNNIAIWQALHNNITGNMNIAIGFNTETSTGNLENTIAFWANSYVSASNTMVLGSVNGVNGATSDIQVVIGSWASSSWVYKVDVQNGYINSSSWLCINWDCKSSWAPDGKNDQYLKRVHIYWGERDSIIRTTNQTSKTIKTIDGDLMNFSDIVCPIGTEILWDFFITYTDSISNGWNPNIELKYSDNTSISIWLSSYNTQQTKYKTVIKKIMSSGIKGNNTDDMTLEISVFMGNETTEYFELSRLELWIYCWIVINNP